MPLYPAKNLDIAQLSRCNWRKGSFHGTGWSLSSKVCTSRIAYESGAVRMRRLRRIALIDFGVKKNIVRCLNERECRVKVFSNAHDRRG